MPLEKINHLFKVEISEDKMEATIDCSKLQQTRELNLTEDLLLKYLEKHNIVYGIKQEAFNKLINGLTKDVFPLVIAEGIAPVDGKDGYLQYNIQSKEPTQLAPDEKASFRDVIRIPTVREGEKLATIVNPTKGKDGRDITGQIIQHQKGRLVTLRAGKNVIYKETDQSFYAGLEGQISIGKHTIDIHPIYEVHDSLSMKTGNIDFVGTVIIHGDVPTGYEIKAGGDVKVFGLVEAASIQSKGSVFISEGLSGLQKGTIEAVGDVHIGYVNQGKIQAKGSIYVEQSIVHSICQAEEEIKCRLGNIIGGSVAAKHLIEARDIGNRLSTKTKVNFPLVLDSFEKMKELSLKKKELLQRLKKLREIGEKLSARNLSNNPQMQDMLRKQRQSLLQTNDQLVAINQAIEELEAHSKKVSRPKLIIRGTIYPQAIVSFGKYKRNFQSESSHVYVTIEGNEIVLHNN